MINRKKNSHNFPPSPPLLGSLVVACYRPTRPATTMLALAVLFCGELVATTTSVVLCLFLVFRGKTFYLFNF